jgi:hypothetical protein
MQTLKLSEHKALQLYPTAPPEWKQVLEESFPKDFFTQKITDRVKTFDDACNVLNLDRAVYNVIVEIASKDAISIKAYAKLCIIARALNEGWEPDWKNENQYKYYPWFKANKSGSGLSCDGCGGWFTYAGVGSRLCYKSRELAEYAGTQFIDIYNDFLTIK